MQPSTIASHLDVEDRASLASPFRLPASLAGHRTSSRASALSRAVQRGQAGLWFRTAAIFLVSLSAGLLALNAFLLFNASASEAADIAFERGTATSVTALPAPAVPAQGVVANAAGVGRVIIAEPLPVATLTTDAYTVVGNGVQASSTRAAGHTTATMASGPASGGRLAPLTAPVPVNMTSTVEPVSVDDARRNADEAMRVIAASTPSVDRARAQDPALVDDAGPAQVEPARGESGVWYGDAGVQ